MSGRTSASMVAIRTSEHTGGPSFTGGLRPAALLSPSSRLSGLSPTTQAPRVHGCPSSPDEPDRVPSARRDGSSIRGPGSRLVDQQCWTTHYRAVVQAPRVVAS